MCGVNLVLLLMIVDFHGAGIITSMMCIIQTFYAVVGLPWHSWAFGVPIEWVDGHN